MNRKVVFRNLLKHPFLNLVKIIGLSLALSGILFICLFLKNELTYDSHHKKAERTYRYTLSDPDFMFGKHFARHVNIKPVEEFPEAISGVEDFVRLRPLRGGLMKYKQLHFSVHQAFEVDSTFFDIFDVPILLGNEQNLLENPASLVLSASFAEKVFGKTNPIGETMVLPAGQYYVQEQQFTVVGVMQDFPSNSHLHPDFVATPVQDKFNTGWAWCYLVLNPNTNAENVSGAIENFLAERFEQDGNTFNTKVHLQNIRNIHLHSHKLREIEPNGTVHNIYVLLIAAFILLVIAISNYTNLNIGMAGYSARYLQVNKLLGSSRALALVYFFYEGSIVLMASVFISVLSIIPINALIVNRYGLHLLENNLGFVSLLIFAYFILSLGFGMLPVLKNSFVSIGIQDKKQGQIRLGKGGINRGLIVFQYAFSIALIISVIVISRQTNYALKESLGVQENNIVVLEKVHANVQQKFSLFKHELSKYNSIESVSAMFEPPGGEANDMFPFELEGFEAQDGDNNNIGVFPCDYAFAEVFGLEFLGGDNFSANNKDNNGLGEFIINEAALKRLQFQSVQEAIGKSFKLMFSVPNTDITIPDGKIIGVVKDFHLSSLKKEVEPLVLFKRDKMWLINFVISFKPGMQENAIADANAVWSNMFPEYPFQYAHVDGLYKEVYKTELLQARLLSIFTVIALFICSLGLFGLALIITQNRMKEIGVRKVNGARVIEILSMLNLDFMKWVLLAFVLACPVAWYAMKLWLQNFAYKTPLSWWIFALSGFIALSIVLITVSVQCWKAATQNPVEALRYE